MKYLFLALALAFSLLCAQEESSDIDLEFLPPDVLKNELVRRELLLHHDAEDSLSLALSQAAIFYYEKNWDSASIAYTPLLEQVSSFLYGPLVIRIARCELERGNVQESRKLLLSFKSLKSNKNSWERADIILLEGILRDTSITSDAKRDSIERRIKARPSASYGQLLKWNLAIIQEKQNNLKSATETYFSVLKGSRPYSDSAFRVLQRLAPNSEDYNFVKTLCRRGSQERCAERIGSIFAKKTKLDSAKWVDLMVTQAEAWRQMSKIDLAIGNYKKLLDSLDYNPVWMQNMIRMARSAGHLQEVTKLDSIFQKLFLFTPENANNLWVKGLEYEQAKDYPKAIETYKHLYDVRFGRHQRKQWAKFRVGFIHFKEEKYAEAANIFIEDANENSGLMPKSASLYFYAECERLLGNKENAANAYHAVIADFPLGYYAWRAKQSLLEHGFANSVPKLSIDMSQDSAIAWLRALQSKGNSGRDTVVGVERLEQIKILLRSGFEEEAFEFYNEVFKLHKNRPEFYYRYGLMFMQSGEHALGYRLARNFQDLVPRQKMTSVPVQVLKFLFPIPHEAKVRKHANIDPYFVYSVMRQESMFDAKIQSPAGARGLLQIMPSTGDFLAKRERIDKFDKDLLFNAYLNIRLGIRLLNDLSVEHKDDYIGILGEYNAGPAPTARWLANHGSLPWDIRVEEVSYWETRDYVKKVLGNYWTYKETYN